MMLRKVTVSLLFVIAVGLLWPTATPGQKTGASPTARKIDEFGDVNVEDKQARLDNFAVAINNDPSVKGYVVIYRAPDDLPGMSARLLSYATRYLTSTRGIPAKRIVALDLGRAAHLVMELWVVSPGTQPEPRADIQRGSAPDLTSVRKFDDYYYPIGEETNDLGEAPGGGGDSLPAFAKAVKAESRATAYVIAYAQNPETGKPDRNGTATKMLNDVRTKLSRANGLAPARIKVIDGGYRTHRAIELWIVPAGGKPPAATPDADPPKPGK